MNLAKLAMISIAPRTSLPDSSSFRDAATRQARNSAGLFGQNRRRRKFAAARHGAPASRDLPLEQRLGASALLLLGGDFGADARDLGFERCNVLLQLGNPEQGQVLRLPRLIARNQLLFVDDCHVPAL